MPNASCRIFRSVQFLGLAFVIGSFPLTANAVGVSEAVVTIISREVGGSGAWRYIVRQFQTKKYSLAAGYGGENGPKVTLNELSRVSAPEAQSFSAAQRLASGMTGTKMIESPMNQAELARIIEGRFSDPQRYNGSLKEQIAIGREKVDKGIPPPKRVYNVQIN